jgi:hypothetical protein
MRRAAEADRGRKGEEREEAKYIIFRREREREEKEK